MEYSLQNLNQNAKLTTIKISEIINKLNLIGFEVDEISKEKYDNNKFFTIIRLLIKLPANRDDLLSDICFLSDLSTILKVKLYKRQTQDYSFLTKQKYSQYKNYSFYSSFQKNLVIYNIELILPEKNFSPKWIQKKLLSYSVKPTNNFIDFLSLIKIEWGQNFSFFSLIFKNKLFLYNFETKEKLLITQERKNIIDQNNKIIDLESLPKNRDFNEEDQLTQKTYLQGIFSNIDSEEFFQRKYLKKQFLENFRFSFQRLLTLLELSTEIFLVPTIYSSFPKSSFPLKITKILKLRKISSKKILNLENYNLSLFKEAGLKLVCKSLNFFYFQVPNYRKDLTREIDLIEEYCRFFGYTNFKELIPKKKLNYYKNYDSKGQYLKFTKQFFLTHGFTEVLTIPIKDISGRKKTNSVVIINPLREDLSLLRKDIITKLIDVFENNLKLNFYAKNYFEIGRSFKIESNKIYETTKLAGIFQLKDTKKSKESILEWFKAKGLLEKYLQNFGAKNISFTKSNFLINSFHKKKSLVIKSNNSILGIFGEINPYLTTKINSKFATYLFEINLKSLAYSKLQSPIILVQELSKYPKLKKDLSFLIKKNTNFLKVKNTIKSISSNIKTIEFFDIYFDEKYPEKVSIGVRLEFQSFFKTLQSQDIEKEIQLISATIVSNFNAILKS